jgi:peptidoglycan/xylan/chitin deacetylase (PgdA/CDA1 family)
MNDMDRTFTIGVLGLQSGLQALLENMGVRFVALNTLPKDVAEHSMIIVHRPLEKWERQELGKLQPEKKSKENATQQLGILYTYESSEMPEHALSREIRRTSITSRDLLGTQLEAFTSVDLYTPVRLFEPLEHLFSAVFLETMGTVYFGFPIEKTLECKGYTRKRFPSTLDLYPNELVSKVHRQKLQDLLQLGLERVLFSLGLPWVQTWVFPTDRPVITLRIDTDFGTQKSMQELFDLAEKHDAKLTNFLHVAAHDDWLEWFVNFPTHEYAIHGYDHAHIRSSYALYQDIEQANERMKEYGMKAKGYAAPYGIWSETLSKVLDTYPFIYSSEFTHGYDGFPYYVKGHQRLQIPIHPICTGSLRRYGACDDDFKYYFQQLLDSKLRNWEAIMLYHHPLQPGASAIDFAMNYANEAGVQWLRYDEWANFWMNRLKQSYDLNYSSQNGVLTGSMNGDIPLLIKTEHDRGFLATPSKVTSGIPIPDQTTDIRWTPAGRSMLSDHFLDHKRTQPWKLWKESLIQYRNRIRI